MQPLPHIRRLALPMLRRLHSSFLLLRPYYTPAHTQSRTQSNRTISSLCLRSSPSITLHPRTMFIQTHATPNPNALKFLPGRPVLGVDGGTVDFSSLKSAVPKSGLASLLFQIESVSGVMLGSDFISVSVVDGSDWNIVKPQVYAAIMDFFATGQPVLKPAPEKQTTSSEPSEEDSEVVAMIKELMETRIRPAVQEDGGDIQFISFSPDTGVVKVQLQGSCKGCSSSAVTLKNGIENMLMHYVPEVTAVDEWKDEVLEAVSETELRKMEEQLKQHHKTQQAQTMEQTHSQHTAA